MKNKKPLVSVAMIAYNHERYIEEAVGGVLMQMTSFDFELIIANDCSSDGTGEIVEELMATRSREHSVKYFSHANNLGMMANFVFALSQCSGKYIALCEGDDFWTDPRKLQKQVDFLERNEDYVMTFHQVNVQNEVEGLVYYYPTPGKDTLNFRELIFSHYIPTCSVLFRREAMPTTFPDWYHLCKMGDIPLELMVASHGLTKYFPEKMAVYRKNDSGITRNKMQIRNGRKAYLYMYQNLNGFFNYNYRMLFLVIIIKIKLGFVKDWLGLNPLLKK